MPAKPMPNEDTNTQRTETQIQALLVLRKILKATSIVILLVLIFTVIDGASHDVPITGGHWVYYDVEAYDGRQSGTAPRWVEDRDYSNAPLTTKILFEDQRVLWLSGAFVIGLWLVNNLVLDEKIKELGSRNYQLQPAKAEQLLSSNPDDLMARNDLGLSYLRQGLPDQALIEIKRARELSQENGIIAYNLAVVYETLEDCQAAIDNYEAALQLDNDFSATQISLITEKIKKLKCNVSRCDLLKEDSQKLPDWMFYDN